MVAKDRISEPSSSDLVVIDLTKLIRRIIKSIAVVQIKRTNDRTEGAIRIKSL